MFGPRTSTVFRSRWNALFWAAGIMLTAYCSVPAAEDGKTDKSHQEAAEKALKQMQDIDLGVLNGEGNQN